jgi:hypothetical protein
MADMQPPVEKTSRAGRFIWLAAPLPILLIFIAVFVTGVTGQAPSPAPDPSRPSIGLTIAAQQAPRLVPFIPVATPLITEQVPLSEQVSRIAPSLRAYATSQPQPEAFRSELLLQTSTMLQFLKVATGDFSSCPPPCTLASGFPNVMDAARAQCLKLEPSEQRKAVSYDVRLHGQLLTALEASCQDIINAFARFGDPVQNSAWTTTATGIIKRLDPIVSAELKK